MISRLLFSSKQPSPPPPIDAASPASASIEASPPPDSEIGRDSIPPGDVRFSPGPADILQGLTDLLQSVPPKTLHQYILDRLPTATPLQLSHFSQFLSGLEPPPVLHCARCHKTYVEVENLSRSCVMEHDDESAEVEHVGWSRGSEYVTTYGCCGESVDGEGDQGPPSGWCFEGKHTNDRQTARYRHDAGSDDDKLDSCAKRRCGQAKPKSRRRKRGLGKRESKDELEPVEGHKKRRTS